jgi:Na+-transporting NADH:ubiquinone oxidoreductase subunit C
MSNDSTKKTLVVTLGVCLVCSILVSTAAITLKHRQEENKKLERLKNILIAGDLLRDDTKIELTFQEKIKAELIHLETGKTVPPSDYNDALDVEKFDINKLARDPNYGQSIPGDQDMAQIRRMPKYMAIYKVIENNQTTKIILPVYGNGLWDMMYGFIALDTDLRTIKGFTFYEHGETPGLGGEVDNPRWKQLWVNKEAYDVNGNIKIAVIKGKVDPSSPDAKYQVDGLSGSTLTTRSVHRLIRFWLGDNGYNPFIQRLREEG